MSARRAVRLADTPEPDDIRAERLARLREQAVLTPAEFALLAGRSRSWVEERVRDGTIPSVPIGTRRILRAAELRATGWL